MKVENFELGIESWQKKVWELGKNYKENKKQNKKKIVIFKKKDVKGLWEINQKKIVKRTSMREKAYGKEIQK